MKKLFKIFKETLPILVGIIFSSLFWENNILLFIIYSGTVSGLIHFHKDKKEWTILFYGILVGTIVEVAGTQIGGYQSFANPDFFGIPIWLPVAWGYGFVMMARIGLILKKSKI